MGAICGAHRHSRFWQHVLEWALILWVVRVPLATTALGLLILGVTPQAQDLFVELARARYERILLFLFLHGRYRRITPRACCSIPTNDFRGLRISRARLGEACAFAGWSAGRHVDLASSHSLRY